MTTDDELRRLAAYARDNWCRDCVYSEVRHVNRNCDIDCGEPHENLGGLGREDGPAIYDAIVALPGLLDRIDALAAKCAAMERPSTSRGADGPTEPRTSTQPDVPGALARLWSAYGHAGSARAELRLVFSLLGAAPPNEDEPAPTQPETVGEIAGIDGAHIVLAGRYHRGLGDIGLTVELVRDLNAAHRVAVASLVAERDAARETIARVERECEALELEGYDTPLARRIRAELKGGA